MTTPRNPSNAQKAKDAKKAGETQEAPKATEAPAAENIPTPEPEPELLTGGVPVDLGDDAPADPPAVPTDDPATNPDAAPPVHPIQGNARNGDPLDANQNGVIDSVEPAPTNDPPTDEAQATPEQTPEPDPEIPEGWSVSHDVELDTYVAEKPADDGSDTLAVLAGALADLPAAIASVVAEQEAQAAKAPDPTSAVIEPPEPTPPTPAPLAIPATVNDAAADRVTQATVIVRDMRGNRVNPVGLFGAADEAGLRFCYIRLIQHQSATAYNRHVETVLLPAGAQVSRDTAAAILRVIADEPAEDVEED